MPIVRNPHVPPCDKELPKELGEIRIRRTPPIVCMLENEHHPPTHCAWFETAHEIVQVSWRDDDSFIPIQTPPGRTPCSHVMPDAVAASLGLAGPLPCSFEQGHRFPSTPLALDRETSPRVAIAWWPRPPAPAAPKEE